MSSRSNPTTREDEDSDEPLFDPEAEWGGSGSTRNRDSTRVHERRWWRKPHPYLLLVISSGQALSVGLVIAPKGDLGNQILCLSYPPPPLELDSTAPLSSSSFSVSSPQLDNDDDDAFTPYLALRSPQHLDTHASISNDTVELGGVLLDKVRCRTDPTVQSKLALFSTVVSILGGGLASLTTGWWGTRSDRVGRTTVMGYAMGGLIFSDIVFLVVARWPGIFSFWLLVLGPVVDGLLGGAPTLGAVNMAYISDSTPDGSRAGIFSLFMGLMMLGIGIGPVLGTWFITLNSNNILSVFYLSTLLHISMLVLVFLLPESLSSETRSALIQAQDRLAAQEEARDEAERVWEREESRPHPRSGGGAGGLEEMLRRLVGRKGWGVVRRTARSSVQFLSPLKVFLPSAREETTWTGGRSWNLTYLAAAQGAILLMMGSYPFYFQYIQLQFAWGFEKIGPLLTLSGGIRAIHLLVVLPAIIRIYKPKPALKVLDDDDAPSHDPGESRFDLKIIKVSLLIDIISYIGILASQSSAQFVIASTLATLGGGAGPAISSIGLELAGSTNAGKFFSAMAVLQSVGSVIGLALYGTIYTLTTSFFPKTIFLLSLTIISFSLFSFSQIQLARPPPSSLEEQSFLLAESDDGRLGGGDRF
ncbi:major facilitator superfamily domain-containing protein [Mrakia frigida]|uniref:major facilitator superfamily domain-containing protein n=1 Tax=Mrakia frigida TaxID=29902 RepID=UPI003FCC05C6